MSDETTPTDDKKTPRDIASTNPATSRVATGSVPATPKVTARAATPAPKRPHWPGKGESRMNYPQFHETEYTPFKGQTNRRLTTVEEKLDAADSILRTLVVRSIGNTLAMAQVAKFETEFGLIKKRLAALDVNPSDDPLITEINAEKRTSLEDKLSSFYRALDGRLTALEETSDDHEGRIAAVETVVPTVASHATQIGDHERMLLIHDSKLENVTEPSKAPLIVGIIVGVLAFIIKAFNPVENVTQQVGNRTIVTSLELYNGFFGSLLIGILFGIIAYLITAAIVDRKKRSTHDESTDDSTAAVKDRHHESIADKFLGRNRDADDDTHKASDTRTVTAEVAPDETVVVTKRDDVDEVNEMFAPETRRGTPHPVRS